MMRFAQFDIVRVSSSEIPGRKLRLFPGRIYVLRSSSEKELSAYRDALFNLTTEKGQFDISLDSQPWSPRDHQFVGFDEVFARSDLRTVYEYLLMKGVPPGSLEALLNSPLLQQLARRRLCSLSDADARMLRLLSVPFGSTNVVVMHDPFDIVSPATRDLISHTLLDYVWKAQALVLVTKLSTRPGPWIGNDLVVRVELDRRLEPTIGFGSGASRSTLLVQTIRAHSTKGAWPMGAYRQQFALAEGEGIDTSGEMLQLMPEQTTSQIGVYFLSEVLSAPLEWWTELAERYATGPRSTRVVILACFLMLMITVGGSLLVITR